MANSPETHAERIIFFDGVCTLCNGFIDFLIKRDTQKRFHYAPLQGQTAFERLPMSRLKLESIVYLKDGITLTHSDAALSVLQDLGGLWNLVSLFKIFPKQLRDSVYKIIALNRYKWFGRRETCRVPTKDERRLFLD